MVALVGLREDCVLSALIRSFEKGMQTQFSVEDPLFKRPKMMSIIYLWSRNSGISYASWKICRLEMASIYALGILEKN